MIRFKALRNTVAVGISAFVSTMLSSPAIAASTGPTVFVTDPTGHRHEQSDPLLQPSGAPDVTFTFDTAAPQQSILGFGGAFTEGSCSTFNRLSPADRAALLDEFYNPAKSNFSTGRLCVGASDYSTQLYSYDDGEADPSLSHFNIDHDRTAVLPVLLQARKIRPDLFLFASPWSPPGWMKYGGSMLGGSIKPHLLGVYSRYTVRYLQAYRAAGIAIDALTIQNEIDADQDGKMPACTWPAGTEEQYIAGDLGPLLKQSGLNTPIWMLDHNYDLAGRVLDQLGKRRVRAFIGAVAWHGYDGDPIQMNAVRKRYPTLPAEWTEGGESIGTKTLATGWSHWATEFAQILNDGASSITTWNLALDEAGRPNIGPFHCAGLVTIDSKTKAVSRNGIYWALVHFAKAMPRGSVVLPAKPIKAGPLSAVAAKRPDGSVAVVLANSGKTATVRLDVSGRVQDVTAGENSVTTVILP